MCQQLEEDPEWTWMNCWFKIFKCWFTLIQALLKVVDKVTKTWTWDRAAIARAWLHHASCHHCKFALMSEQNLERPAIRCRRVSVSYVSLLMQLMLSVGPESRCRLSYIDSTASLRLWRTSKRSLAFSCFFQAPCMAWTFGDERNSLRACTCFDCWCVYLRGAKGMTKFSTASQLRFAASCRDLNVQICWIFLDKIRFV